jgi:hypothetical protein
MTLVTRNVSDFGSSVKAFVNPWSRNGNRGRLRAAG